MRPERSDIGAPVLPGRIRWLNAPEPPELAALTAAGPVLVHFFDFAQLNSARAMPYVVEWQRRYGPFGLSVLGIHSPRFRFTGEADALQLGVALLGITHPVADDSDYAVWHDYGCKGWPSLFLWGQGGALAWAHFGEGEYEATERAIQEALREDDLTLELPEPIEPLRPTDAPGALVIPPSAEVFPGGSPATGWEPAPGEDTLRVEYEAGGVWIVAEGEGELEASLDGGEAVALEPSPAALIEVARHPGHEAHTLELRVGAGLRVWAISFEPGLAPHEPGG